jgi:hypothetical protein
MNNVVFDNFLPKSSAFVGSARWVTIKKPYPCIKKNFRCIRSLHFFYLISEFFIETKNTSICEAST